MIYLTFLPKLGRGVGEVVETLASVSCVQVHVVVAKLCLLLGQVLDEGEGLEASLSYSRPRLKSKVSSSNSLDPPERMIGYPDPHSPNAPSVLRSLVQALMYKCVWYYSVVPMLSPSPSVPTAPLPTTGYGKG